MNATRQRQSTLYMKDFDGLRGILSVWIVLFHSFHYSQLHFIDLQGSTLMSLFFLLSGFGITIGYADTMMSQGSRNPRTTPHAVDQQPDHAINVMPVSSDQQPENTINVMPLLDQQPDNPMLINAIEDQLNEKVPIPNQPTFWVIYLKYLYNRCIRILPVYWICMCFAIPPTLAGFGNFNPNDYNKFVESFVQSYIPTNTWTFFLVGIPIDGPGWTISTLFAFYIIFPVLLHYLYKLTDVELIYHIRLAYWIQFLLIAVVLLVSIILNVVEIGFWFATSWPPSRIGVFTMSIAAALLCKRYENSASMPWFLQSGQLLPISFWGCCGCCCCQEEKCHPNCRIMVSTEVNYEKSIFYQWLQFMGLTALFIIIRAIIADTAANFWFQGMSVFGMLDFMVCLVRSKGSTRMSRFLSHPICTWLGEISMSLYLIHEPLIYYFYWFQNGLQSIPWLTCSSDDTNCRGSFQEKRTMSSYGIALILPIALVLAVLLYYGVEIPANKYLRWK